MGSGVSSSDTILKPYESAGQLGQGAFPAEDPTIEVAVLYDLAAARLRQEYEQNTPLATKRPDRSHEPECKTWPWECAFCQLEQCCPAEAIL